MFSSNKWTCCESRDKECEECTRNPMVGKWSCCGEANGNNKRCPRSPGAMKEKAAKAAKLNISVNELSRMETEVAAKMNLSVAEIVSF